MELGDTKVMAAVWVPCLPLSPVNCSRNACWGCRAAQSSGHCIMAPHSWPPARCKAKYGI